MKRAKKIVVFRPPPIFQAVYAGTMNSSENRAMLEKLSEPGPSAGRGAFLIAGNYNLQLAWSQQVWFANEASVELPVW